MRPRLFRSVLGVAVLTAVWFGYRQLDESRYRAALGSVEQDVYRGRFDTARAALGRLSSRWPGRDEADFWLGRCEEGANRPDAALAAWARVPARSPLGPQAAIRSAGLCEAGGRLDAAERALMTAAGVPGPGRSTVRTRLAEILFLEGREDEAIRLIEANWYAMTEEEDADPSRPYEALDMLLTHLEWGFTDRSTDDRRAKLDRAAALAPGDDRVWLGRANLAIRATRYDEAEALLDACIRRRPDDPAVWKARLDRAVAADRADQAREALAHVRADSLAPARVCSLRAWFAAHKGDDAASRRATEQEVEADPASFAALERLAELALQGGDPRRAERLRRGKGELDRALQYYRHAYFAMRHKDGRALLTDLTREAPKMAPLAEALGRRFEARALYALILRLSPGNPRAAEALNRLGRGSPPRVEAPGAVTGPTLAEGLKDVLGPLRSRSLAPERVAAPRFEDDAAGAGLRFRYENGASPLHLTPESVGGGVALLDYDGDGRLDVYCVQAGPFPPRPDSRYEGDRLFRNRGDGTFEDATVAARVAGMKRGYGHGAAVGDYDNDGHPDLFVTRWGAYALYRNRGDGTFEERTGSAGLDGDRGWPTSAAFADLDNDGDLDLYVCHYAAFDTVRPQICRDQTSKKNISCSPLSLVPEPDHVFRNDGGRFVDVTAEAGVREHDGRGLGVVAADLDGDGRVDLFVANDQSANFLWRNTGGFRFEEVGAEAGAAANAQGGYKAGMGVACGDLDGDGREDLAVTNFYGEATTFYKNLGGGMFADRTGAIGLARPSRDVLGFGVTMFDANNDGRLDLMTANGHVDDLRPEEPYEMPAQLLIGTETGRLVDVTAEAGSPFRAVCIGRGLAAGDLDNDGRPDALLLPQNRPLVYFHNRTAGAGHFLSVLLQGRASNRDGVGARITLHSAGRRQVAQRTGGGSYCSAGDPRMHFGLGSATRVDTLEVRWPSGRVDRHEGLAADAGYRLREGDPRPELLNVWTADASGRK